MCLVNQVDDSRHEAKMGDAYASVSPPFNRKRAKSSNIMSSSCASSLYEQREERKEEKFLIRKQKRCWNKLRGELCDVVGGGWTR